MFNGSQEGAHTVLTHEQYDNLLIAALVVTSILVGYLASQLGRLRAGKPNAASFNEGVISEAIRQAEADEARRQHRRDHPEP